MCSERYGRLALSRLLFIGGAPDDGAGNPLLAAVFWGDPSNLVENQVIEEHLHGEKFQHWLKTSQWLMDGKYPSNVWQQNAFRLKSLYRRLSSICLLLGGEERVYWWQGAVEELQKHSSATHPVILPILLLASNLKMASTSLQRALNSIDVPGAGLVTRSVQEACVFESRDGTGALNYVRGAYGEKRVTAEFLCQFSGWARLLQGNDVAMGAFNYTKWLSQLAKECEQIGPDTDDKVDELLSSGHFIACLKKAKRRTEHLVSITSQDFGQWLCGPISYLDTTGDKVVSAIRSVLGPQLNGAHAEIFLDPLKTMLLEADELLTNRLSKLTGGCCLIALLFRAKAANRVTTERMYEHFAGLLPSGALNGDPSEKIRDQVSLIIGTAPELFCFYYLLFTLSLPPTP
jgi:hypothetical protein